MGERSDTRGELGDDFSWSILDVMPESVIVVASDGEIAYANDRAAEVFAATTSDLVGTCIDNLVPQAFCGERGTRPTHSGLHTEGPTTGAGVAFRARRLDGTEFSIEVGLGQIQLGDTTFILATVRDVTEQIAAEDHLQRVLRTLDFSDDALFMFDADTLRYIYVNEGGARLVGYDRDEFFEMTPLDINAHSSEAEFRDLVQRLLHGPDAQVRHKAVLLRHDGTEVPVDKTFHAAPARDGSRWIIVTARDVSEQLAAEEELRRKQAALQAAESVALVAQDRERIARDLHDTVIQRLFGTGLSLQSVAAMAEGRVRDRLELAIDDIDETIRELRSAIFSLNGAVHADTGSLRSILLEVIIESARGSGIEPRLQLDGALDSLSPAIVEHLVPTLREALSNVTKHARAQNVHVVVAAHDEVAIIVTDDGVGVSGEVLGGRGLVNLRERAAALGGTVELTALPERGTRFTWRVPSH